MQSQQAIEVMDALQVEGRLFFLLQVLFSNYTAGIVCTPLYEIYIPHEPKGAYLSTEETPHVHMPRCSQAFVNSGRA